MAKPAKVAKSGFVIKLSSETAQKLAEEDSQARNVHPEDSGGTESCSNREESEVGREGVPSGQEPEGGEQSAPATAAAAAAAASDGAGGAAEAWGAYAAHVAYEGALAVYTDPCSRQRYSWREATGAWEPLAATAAASAGDTDRQYTYENDTHVYTESDGSKFFYDAEKKAWIPQVDDDFLAYYQMSYGFVDNTAKETENKKEGPPKAATDKEKKGEQGAGAGGAKRKSEPQWFEPPEETNTKVYVSNLPLDMTEEEFVELMGKCGLVERDPASQKMKVKLYCDKERGCFKGDALCTYIKVESVELALNLLDGAAVRGQTIRVERAHFQLKGEYNPTLKPKKKKKKEIEKLNKLKQRLFDWRPEKLAGERAKHERVVIIKNLFQPSDFDQEVQLLLDYQADLREECSKAGEVRKVVLFDRHPEGVAQVTMAEPEQADAVVRLVGGRWFGQRQISAEIWDGRTKYRIAETDAALSHRIDKWDRFLEGKDEGGPSAEHTPQAGPSAAQDTNTANPDGGNDNQTRDSSEDKKDQHNTG